MEENIISDNLIKEFAAYLSAEEKSDNTISKYVRDVKALKNFCGGLKIDKHTVLAYKQKLIADGYAVSSINSMIASINSLFAYAGWNDFKVRSLKAQKQIFCSEDKELTRSEYERLCNAAKEKDSGRTYLILQTICGTGVRVSELEFITVEAVKKGEARVCLKGKMRSIFIVKKLQKRLLKYIAQKNIKTGPVFITRTGKPMNRTNIWREMKSLCVRAGVNQSKVFPHNLRHLFARIFYNAEKDIVKLADILGHSSIDTTRLYIISTGAEHRKRMESLRLII